MILRNVDVPWTGDAQDAPYTNDAWGAEIYNGETVYDVPGVGKLCKENFEMWVQDLSLEEVASAFGVELVEVEL